MSFPLILSLYLHSLEGGLNFKGCEPFWENLIEPAAEKSSAYATILVSEIVFVLVISYTISMSAITDNA